MLFLVVLQSLIQLSLTYLDTYPLAYSHRTYMGQGGHLMVKEDEIEISTAPQPV